MQVLRGKPPLGCLLLGLQAACESNSLIPGAYPCILQSSPPTPPCSVPDRSRFAGALAAFWEATWLINSKHRLPKIPKASPSVFCPAAGIAGRSLGSGLQARGVPLWLSLSLKPRGGRSMPTRLSQASDSGFDFSVAFSGCDEWCPCLAQGA